MSLVGVSGSENLELENSYEESETIKMSNEVIGKKLKSPMQKEHTSTQSNILNNWLTKDTSKSHVSSRCTEIIKNKKDRKHSSDNLNSHSGESQCDRETDGDLNMALEDNDNGKTDVENQKRRNEERSSLRSNDTVSKKKHKNKKKSRQDRSDVIKKLKDKSASQEKIGISRTDKESISKKKFKSIMSPLNTKNVDTKKKCDKNASPQTNILSKWVIKHDSGSDILNSSISISIKEKLNKGDRKETLDNTKSTETENILKISNKIKSNDSKLTFKEPKKEKGSSVSSPDLEINSKTQQMDIDKKSKKNERYSKYNLTSKDSLTSETNHTMQQKEIDATPIKQESKSSSIRSPKSTKLTKPGSTSRKLFDIDLFSQSGTSNVWLSKDMTSTKSSKDTNKTNTSVSKKLDKKSARYNKLDVKVNSKKPKQGDKGSSSGKSIQKNESRSTGKTLDDYLKKYLKESTKRKFSRSDSNESCEFPSFTNNNKKSKTNTAKDSFHKYGVNIPSVEEIIKDQKDFAEYKNQIDSFKDIDDKFLEIPFSLQDLKAPSPEVKENVLGCEHLSIEQIEKAFNDNLDYISAIFHGKKYSERHERFFEKNIKSYTFTVKDLCYNTSTIVFNFEQVEHMITLLKKEFDPDDKWTSYFFQVLLPELCLKIFMDTHSMTHDEAVKYLDTRPVD